MAFVAHARPEQSDTHSCSLNKGIGCKSRTRNEAGSAAQTKQSGFPKVAVFLKCCFPCRTHPACGENRSLEGLSWLREKAEAMRLCEGKSSAHEWISQKTYKPPKRKKPVRDTHGTFQHLNSPAYAQPEFLTQRRWLLQSSFFSCLRTRQKLDFLRIQQKSPI